jgi:hypothetical protein
MLASPRLPADDLERLTRKLGISRNDLRQFLIRNTAVRLRLVLRAYGVSIEWHFACGGDPDYPEATGVQICRLTFDANPHCANL